MLDAALSGGRAVADHKIDAAGQLADHKMDAAGRSADYKNATGRFAFKLCVLTPSMAANDVVPVPFLDALSGCKTIEQLNHFISLSTYSMAINGGPENHDPSQYHIIQIDVLKRHALVQHERIILTVRRQASSTDAFFLEINRDVKSLSFLWAFSTCFLSRKPCIDRVTYIPVTQPPSLSNSLWTEQIGYGRLTLTQVTKLLYAISAPVQGMQNQYYHLTKRNCFWFTRVFIRMVRQIAPAQINDHTDRTYCCYTLGHCFGFRANGFEPDNGYHENDPEIVGLQTRYNRHYDEVSATFLNCSLLTSL